MGMVLVRLSPRTSPRDNRVSKKGYEVEKRYEVDKEYEVMIRDTS